MNAWGNSFGSCNDGDGGTVIVESIGVSMTSNEIETVVLNTSLIDVMIGENNFNANVSTSNILVSISIND